MRCRQKRVAAALTGAILAAVSVAGSAAVLDVAQVTVTDAGFSLSPPQGSVSSFTVSNLTPAADSNVIASAKNPLLTFDLSLNTGASTFAGPAVAYTKTALSAVVDTATNSIAVNFGNIDSAFAVDWNGGAFCTPPRPDCLDVAQGPLPSSAGADAVATGSWDPLTRAFSVTWTRLNNGHPFDNFTSTWTWEGVAQPVPEPGAFGLLLTGLAMLAAAALRRGRASTRSTA